MRVSTGAKKFYTRIDLSPMLDVIFQLVLFFLVSTTLSTSPSISVTLPESATSELEALSAISVTVAEDGSLWFNEEKVTISGLEERLLQFDVGELSRKEFPVSLSADEMVTSGRIVEIFDAISGAGFSQISLLTRRKRGDGS